MFLRLSLALLLITCSTSPLFSQDFIGLWTAQSVRVGEDVMTPEAKWSNIAADSTFTSGNGWLQNSAGTWTYDEETKQILTNSKQDIEGQTPFTVSFDGDVMVWEREEQGQTVIVRWVSIDELPMRANDMLVGVWDLVEYKSNSDADVSTYDKDGLHYIFFSWDGRYRIRHVNGEMERGTYWVHPHRRELRLYPWEGESRVIEVSTMPDHLIIMKNDPENPEVKTYDRIMRIPN